MDGFILRYFLIELIGVFDRTVFYASRTTRAFVFENIPGLLDQGDLKVSRFTFDAVNFGIRQDLYVGMPADLDQFGREYSDGAVIGRKGLIELGHMAANGRRFVNQVNLKSRGGEIKRGLNAADPSANHHYITKKTAFEALPNTLCETFANLVLNLL
jgi:hypothetical protein